MMEVAHRLSTSKSMDDVTNILHRTYEVCMRIKTDRKSQRTTVGQKARQADHLAWSEDPPFLRELYSLFPKMMEVAHRLSTSKSMDDVTNILHRTYEVCMRIKTDRKSQRTTVGQKARQADHLAWSEDPPFLRELYSLSTTESGNVPDSKYNSFKALTTALTNIIQTTPLTPSP
ncbi:hypothetical protein SFRURICE_010405 [Spodoptera frugiperda]|nr:hypothetical protein SFRURICE_010405 [Spodoptera frugiperda]